MISGESDSRKCHYPSWFLAHNRWQTLDGRWSYNPHKNTTLRITNIAAHGTVSSSAGPSFSSGGSSSSGVDSRQEQKAVCQSVLDLGDGTARVVAHLSQGWCVSVTFRDTRSSLSLSSLSSGESLRRAVSMGSNPKSGAGGVSLPGKHKQTLYTNKKTAAEWITFCTADEKQRGIAPNPSSSVSSLPSVIRRDFALRESGGKRKIDGSTGRMDPLVPALPPSMSST